MTNSMFLSVGAATPDARNAEYRQDTIYPILVFVLSEDEKKAEALAIDHMQSTGWSKVVIDKTDPVDISAIKNAQPEIQSAYTQALNAGSHGMVIGSAA